MLKSPTSQSMKKHFTASYLMKVGSFQPENAMARRLWIRETGMERCEL